MAEYIERDAAIKTVVEMIDNGLAATSNDLAEVLADLPAADVAPVRHGRWIRVDSPGYRCSECGCLDFAKVYQYCPNCGAKMDAQESERAERPFFGP